MVDKVLTAIGTAVASKLTGVNEDEETFYPFVDNWDYGFPDDEFIENCDIAEGKPHMNVYGSFKYVRDWSLVDQEGTQSKTSIVHEGTSVLNFALEGDHRGNNDYVLEIITGGALGTALYHLSMDGGESWGDPIIVPANGRIIIGDGTTIVFTGVGDLVTGDRYSWQTVSLITQKYRSYRFMGSVDIELLAAAKTELMGDPETTGYLDQLVNLFSDKAGVVMDSFSHITTSIKEMPSPTHDIRVNKYRGTVIIDVEGCLYVSKDVPMIGEIEVTGEIESVIS